MAHTTMVPFSAAMFVGDTDAQLVAGDLAGFPLRHLGRAVMSYDDTQEMATVSHPIIMPGQYNGGTLTTDIGFWMASDNTNDIALDVFIEAVTPNADTLNMVSATSWDTANSGTISLSGSTASDLLMLSITLTNDGSPNAIVAGDWFRLGIRRDTDSLDDDATGLLYLSAVDLWETT